MKFLVNNLEYWTCNNIIHTQLTRNTVQLHESLTKLSLCERCVYYINVKVFNKLHKYIVDFVENRKQFIRKLKKVLLDLSFYSVKEFLNYSYDL
jgi:hypothetical protein